MSSSLPDMSLRLHRIVDAALSSTAPEDFAEFLEEPNALSEGMRPWDLLTACDESEFERVMEIVRGLAGKNESDAGPAIR